MNAGTFVRFERRFAIPERGGRRDLVCVRRPGMRFYVVDTAGVVMDSRATASLPPMCMRKSEVAAQITIPLAGAFIARRVTRTLELTPRTAAVDPLGTWDERWEGARFRALVVEWDAQHGSTVHGLCDLPLGSADVAAFSDVANRIDADVLDATTLRDAIDRLRALGVPLHPPDALPLVTPPSGAAALVRAVGRILSRLDEHPDQVDLAAELGVTPRQVHRVWGRVHAWVGFPTSWRTMLSETRLTLATTAATAPALTVERIASLVGYRGPSALLAALRAAGLDSPSRIRAVAGVR